MQRVVITGSSGYVGRKLTASFRAEGAKVLGIDVRPADDDLPDEFEQRDVCDPSLVDVLDGFRPDTVIHGAFVVQPRRDRCETRRINIDGTKNVLSSIAAARPARTMFISSATVYGAAAANPIPIDDDHPPSPANHFTYAAEKAEVEGLFADFAHRHPEQAVSWVRPTIVGGPLMDNYIRRMIFGMPFLVKLDGFDQMFQIVHESDLVGAIRAVLAADGRGAYNIAPPDWIRFSDLGRRTSRWTVGMPFWFSWFVYGCGWWLRLPYPETPPSFLKFVRYPWVVRARRLEQEIGYRFRYTSEQTMNCMLDAARPAPVVLNSETAAPR